MQPCKTDVPIITVRPRARGGGFHRSRLMTVTVGIIIGVTLFFTVCSIVLSRRSQDEEEFSLSVTKASWENGGRDLTSPMMGGGEIEVVSSPRFQPLTPPPGSRMRPVDAPSEARPVTPQVSQLFRAPAAQTQCYDLDALWQHSIAVAQVADHLARRTGKADPDLASTLGLLHDIGKLAINSQFPQKVAQLWRPMGLVGVPDRGTGESWLARERRLFGADHAFMGGFLAARWMLPEEITDGLRLHPPPSESVLDGVAEPLRRAIQVVHVANQLVKYRHCYCADMEIDTLDPALLSELGLPVEMEQIFDEKIERAITAAAVMAKPPAESAGMRISA